MPGTGRLAGLTGRVVLVAAPALGTELVEHPAQRGLAEPAQRLRREAQALVVAGQPALPAQLALELAQRLDVGRGPGAELALDRLDVDVVQRGAGVVLAELVGQGVQVGQLLQGLGRLAVGQRLVAVDVAAAAPVQPGPQVAQVVAQGRHLGREVGVGQGVGHQLGQLLPLLGRQRPHEALGRRGLPGQGVDQLVDGLRVVGEHVAVRGP